MLTRKLWRDLKQNYGAYLACASVLVIGLMLYVSLAVTLESLVGARDTYYQKNSFADGFARIAQGPSSLTEDLQAIPGVERATGRLVRDLLVNRPEGSETTTVRLVGFSPDGGRLNRFQLETGYLPAQGAREILVSSAFLKGNNLRLGDRIPLILQGRETEFTVTGTMRSPEYVYEIPGSQTLAPDPKTFGVAFIPNDTIAQLLGMSGQINDLAFSLRRGTSFDQVKTRINRLLEPYGLQYLVSRKDQISNSMLNQEVAGLKASATTTPFIFLLVAAAILYIVLRRMVEQQRGQIGIMKAFGFTNREVLSHYLSYAAFIGVVGGLGGSLSGLGFSYVLAKIYTQYYNIPGLTGKFSLTYLAAGTLLSLAFSCIAGYQGCKGILALAPSEAMRPPAPKSGNRTFLERLKPLWSALRTSGKMAVRNIFRSRQRSILAIFGIACAFAMMITSSAMFDSTYYLIDFQYNLVERYDLKISLAKPALIDAVNGGGLTGVRRSEPLLEVPVTIRRLWLQKDTAILGLPSRSTLYRLADKQGRQITVPPNGLTISSQLAKLLQISPGDRVTIKPLLGGDREEREVTVRQVIPQYVGLAGYMEIGALSRQLNEAPVASALLLQVEPSKQNQLRKQLQTGRNVAAIYDKSKMQAQFVQLMDSSKSTQYVLLVFGLITGFAIVYNVNLISLAERERELATLMVLGMTTREIERILYIEQSILGALALAAGIPMGYGMMAAIVSSSSNDIYNMPLVIAPGSILLALGGTVLFIVAAQWRINGKIGKLSLLDVLKQQE